MVAYHTLDIFVQILPLYISIFIGRISCIKFGLDQGSLSKFMFYMLYPPIVFNSTLKVHLSSQVLTLPLISFSIASIICFLVYRYGHVLFEEQSRSILAFGSSTGSAGFFGLPIALTLFDEPTVHKYIICFLGLMVFENSYGFYVAARGTLSRSEALMRFAKIPTLYCAVLGFLLNYLGWSMPSFLNDMMTNCKGTYILLGSMMVGIATADVKLGNSIRLIRKDARYLAVIAIMKFGVWPAIIMMLVTIDEHVTHLYNVEIYNILELIAIIPMSQTNIILGPILNYTPERSARVSLSVLVNTYLAALYVPIIIPLIF